MIKGKGGVMWWWGGGRGDNGNGVGVRGRGGGGSGNILRNDSTSRIHMCLCECPFFYAICLLNAVHG